MSTYSDLGAVLSLDDEGWRATFRVWSPRAESVAVIGDFNDWIVGSHALCRGLDGIWTATVRGAKPDDKYMFVLGQNKDNSAGAGKLVSHFDPRARRFCLHQGALCSMLSEPRADEQNVETTDLFYMSR